MFYLQELTKKLSTQLKEQRMDITLLKQNSTVHTSVETGTSLSPPMITKEFDHSKKDSDPLEVSIIGDEVHTYMHIYMYTYVHTYVNT